jgi:hypothetical protein
VFLHRHPARAPCGPTEPWPSTSTPRLRVHPSPLAPLLFWTARSFDFPLLGNAAQGSCRSTKCGTSSRRCPKLHKARNPPSSDGKNSCKRCLTRRGTAASFCHAMKLERHGARYEAEVPVPATMWARVATPRRSRPTIAEAVGRAGDVPYARAIHSTPLLPVKCENRGASRQRSRSGYRLPPNFPACTWASGLAGR